jgi:hypothetical protein
MKFPDISKRPWRNIDFIIIGITNILDGIGTILSLGYWLPWSSMKYVIWRTERMMKDAMD